VQIHPNDDGYTLRPAHPHQLKNGKADSQSQILASRLIPKREALAIGEQVLMILTVNYSIA